MNKRYSMLTQLLGIVSVVNDDNFVLMRCDMIDFIRSWLSGGCLKIDSYLYILVRLCSCLYRTLLSYLHNCLNIYYIWHFDIPYTTLEGLIHLLWFTRSIYASSSSYSVFSFLFITSLSFSLGRTLVSVSILNTSTLSV